MFFFIFEQTLSKVLCAVVKFDQEQQQDIVAFQQSQLTAVRRITPRRSPKTKSLASSIALGTDHTTASASDDAASQGDKSADLCSLEQASLSSAASSQGDETEEADEADDCTIGEENVSPV